MEIVQRYFSSAVGIQTHMNIANQADNGGNSPENLDRKVCEKWWSDFQSKGWGTNNWKKQGGGNLTSYPHVNFSLWAHHCIKSPELTKACFSDLL